MNLSRRKRKKAHHLRRGRAFLSTQMIPSVFTLGNLTSGVVALIATQNRDFEKACWLILLGMVFDALDGFIARATGTSSSFGVQLDSLADVVTFGVAPALLIYEFVKAEGLPPLLRPFTFAMVIYFVACVAIRLARFNLLPEETDRRYFSGLPSPMGALGVVAMVFWLPLFHLSGPTFLFPLLLLGLIGSLMVSNLRYRSTKKLYFRSLHPMTALASVALFMAFFVAYPKEVLLVFTTLYILSGPVHAGFLYLHTKKRTESEVQAENISLMSEEHK